MRRALAASFAANCVLLVVRAALAILSASLSLVIATLDAVLDVVSSVMLYWSTAQAKQRNKCEPWGAGEGQAAGGGRQPACCAWGGCRVVSPRSRCEATVTAQGAGCLCPSPLAADAYPVGKERMEPLGIIVFSVIMGTAAFQVIVFSIKVRPSF